MFEPGSIEVPRRRHTRRPAGIEKRPGRPIIRSHSLSNYSASACGAREWKRRLRPAKLSSSATEMSRRCVTHQLKTGRLTSHGRNRGLVRSRPRVCPFWGSRSPAPGHAVTAQNSRRATAGALAPTAALTHLPAGPSAARRCLAGLAAAGAASNARVHPVGGFVGRETRPRDGCCMRWA